MSKPAESKLSLALWWVFNLLSLAAAVYLLIICLFGEAGVLAKPAPAQSPSDNTAQLPTLTKPQQDDRQVSNNAPQNQGTNSFEAERIKISGLESKTIEMSKRIDDLGNHSIQILNVIGLLAGFITIIVTIGLWQSKQYIDRIAEHHKSEMKNFIREETERQLNEIKAATSSQTEKAVRSAVEELDRQKTTAVQELEGMRTEASATILSLSDSRADTSLRLGLLLIERITYTFNNILDTAFEKKLISAEDQRESKSKLEFSLYAQKELLRALVQLESSHVSEVIAGCHTISALQDRTCLPSLKQALVKWSKIDDPRVVKQISATYEKLVSTQE